MRRRTCCTCCTSRLTLQILGSIALLFNLHHALLASPISNCIFSSLAFVGLNRLLVLPLLSATMRSYGVPVGGNRTEQYATTPAGFALNVDVYEPPEESVHELRPAGLYFHAGGFNALGRELCGGTLAWLAAHGLVGFSASYRLTNDLLSPGAGVAGAIDDAWTALRWLRTDAARLRIDPKRIVALGDSAGGGLALALASGLRPGAPPAPRAELPAACLAGYAASGAGFGHTCGRTCLCCY